MGEITTSINRVDIPGMTLHQATIDDATQALFVTLAHDYFEPRIVAAPETGIRPRAAMASLNVVIGSGYVTHARSLTPVGLLKVADQTLSPLEPYGYTRILGLNEQGLGVVHRSRYEKSLFQDALQLGPGIVESGQLDISKRDLERPRYHRSFIALCENLWVVGITLDPSHLRTLGQAFLEVDKKNNWQCSEMINLAGDREAVLLLRDQNNQVLYHGLPGSAKASLLGFVLTPP